MGSDNQYGVACVGKILRAIHFKLNLCIWLGSRMYGSSILDFAKPFAGLRSKQVDVMKVLFVRN